MIVSVDFGKNVRAMKALHGVNNAPMRLDGPQREFRDAGIPFVRTHDTAGAYGGAHFVDIPNLFPNFDADENDPASYDFALTDAYLKPLVEAGVEPFYRLGITIENYHKIRAYNIAPPKDFAKWARICEHVVMHYNEGWSNGFRWNIRYWEIWNEPENPPMWSGTREQFFQLYATAATHLRSRFPDIRIGGYGGCGFYAITNPEATPFYKSFVTWFEEFCAFVQKNRLPLDFFSWHLYTTSPELILTHADYVRGVLDQHGLRKTESIFDEWNYVQPNHDWNAMKEMPGAAFVASAFCLMQKGSVDKAMYYDALPTRCYCGLFYFPVVTVTPCYYAFQFFNELYRLGDEVECEASEEGIHCCAATNGVGKAILLVNNTTEARQVHLHLKGAEEAEFRLRILDSSRKAPHEEPMPTVGGIWLSPLSLCLLCNNEVAASSGEAQVIRQHAGLEETN